MVKSSSQASVRNYDAQLATAVAISNRNLVACNPELDEQRCIEVRALYWKFQLAAVSRKGLEALPETLDGFCRRFRIEDNERALLREKVLWDALNELHDSPNINGEDQSAVGSFLFERLGP